MNQPEDQEVQEETPFMNFVKRAKNKVANTTSQVIQKIKDRQ